MRNFLKAVLAVIVGTGVFFALIFGIGLLIISAASSSEPAGAKPNSVLRLKLNRPIVEYTSEKDDPFSELSVPTGIPFMEVSTPIGLINLKETIQKAKADDNIKGIYLDLSIVSGGWSQLYDIRNAILDFKESGKFVYAYGELMTEPAYFLASAADEVYLMPQGGLPFIGLSVEKMYYKGMFEKIGLKPKVYKVGDFKSYVEPFLRSEMSEADRLQTSAYLNSVYDFYLKEVSKSRGIEVTELERISDQMLVRMPGDAVKFGLLSDTLYEDQVFDKVRERLDIEADAKINFISYNKYRKAPSSIPKVFAPDNKIAVIIGEGGIGSGKSEDGTIGSATIVKELRKARKDDKVKAVVLRINSPGGSALASDEMWREVQLVKAKKPIIASMSDVAASGGYYMAMGCDTIVAQPNTITGSIGIFAILINAKEALNDKLGLTFSRVNTGEFSDLGSPTHEFSEAEDQRLQYRVDQGYEDFTRKAARGRGMSQDSLKKIASGRVWTGEQALENGLIDVFGDLDYAVELAARKAGISEEDKYMVVYRPKPENVFEKLFGSGIAKAQEEELIRENLGELAPYWQELRQIARMEGVQARMPYRIRITGKARR